MLSNNVMLNSEHHMMVRILGGADHSVHATLSHYSDSDGDTETQLDNGTESVTETASSMTRSRFGVANNLWSVTTERVCRSIKSDIPPPAPPKNARLQTFRSVPQSPTDADLHTSIDAALQSAMDVGLRLLEDDQASRLNSFMNTARAFASLRPPLAIQSIHNPVLPPLPQSSDSRASLPLPSLLPTPPLLLRSSCGLGTSPTRLPRSPMCVKIPRLLFEPISTETARPLRASRLAAQLVARGIKRCWKSSASLQKQFVKHVGSADQVA